LDQTNTAAPAGSESSDVSRQRATVLYEIAIAFPAAIALWLATYYSLPPLSGMDDALARVIFALKCSCVAILFCFLTGIEAVAHERLRSPAIDPLAGYETRRMAVNLRYLQNTLEQLMLFVPGLLGLAVYCSDGEIDAGGCRDNGGLDRFARRVLDLLPSRCAASRRRSARRPADPVGPALRLREVWL